MGVGARDIPERVFVWDEAMLAIGRARASLPHDCHAITIDISVDAPVGVRVRGGSWGWPRAVAMPADVSYQTCGPPVVGATVFLDPEALGVMLERPVELPNRLARELASVCRRERTDASAAHVTSLCLRWLRSVGKARRLDRRVRNLAGRLSSSETSSATLDELSSLVRLSTDHTSRLFREQIGTTLPTFRLWARTRHAIRELAGGANVAAAAAAAGFADGAHLSRCFRRFFGVQPRVAVRMGLRPAGAELALSLGAAGRGLAVRTSHPHGPQPAVCL